VNGLGFQRAWIVKASKEKLDVVNVEGEFRQWFSLDERKLGFWKRENVCERNESFNEKVPLY